MKYQNPALAQLEEHLTVEVTWKSRGPWFKSGKPDFFLKYLIVIFSLFIKIIQIKDTIKVTIIFQKL